MQRHIYSQAQIAGKRYRTTFTRRFGTRWHKTFTLALARGKTYGRMSHR